MLDEVAAVWNIKYLQHILNGPKRTSRGYADPSTTFGFFSLLSFGFGPF
jgi:hypothetical protein